MIISIFNFNLKSNELAKNSIRAFRCMFFVRGIDEIGENRRKSAKQIEIKSETTIFDTAYEISSL